MVLTSNELLTKLFNQHFNETVLNITPISPHASSRVLVRLQSAERSVVGVHYENIVENKAFISFSQHFLRCKLPVPQIYCVSEDQKLYLQEDLGNETLYDRLQSERGKSGSVPPAVRDLYAETVRLLSYFQIEASRGIDYSLCAESVCYDKEAMLFDCNRFATELVQRMSISYRREQLASDFDLLTNFLNQADQQFFLYRDFQSRNVMIKDEKPYFIDYQSGRHGALQYDLASMLYQSQAKLPEEMRENLIDTYLAQVGLRMPINRNQFIEYFDGFVLIRLLQVLGAYGKLGLGENRAYFLQGIPFAIATFLEVLGRKRLPLEFAEITPLFARLARQLE